MSITFAWTVAFATSVTVNGAPVESVVDPEMVMKPE